MKKGIGFFPVLCTQSTAEEVLEAEFGAVSTALIVALYRKIYGENGFYCEFSWQVQKLMAAKMGMKSEEFEGFLKMAFELELFDRGMYEAHGILTSAAIQEHFFYAVSRRKPFEFKREYLLLRDDQLPAFLQLEQKAQNQDVDRNQENVSRNQENADRNEENDDRIKQTKQYETKQDDTKQNETKQNETIKIKTMQDKKPENTLPTYPQEVREDEEAYFGTYANVRLRFGEFKALVQRYGEYAVDRYIERLSSYMESKDRDYPDHANTLLDWMEKDRVKPINGR